MSHEAVQRFLEKTEDDRDLQRELASALERGDGAVQAVLAVAREHGCEFTADEYLAVSRERGIEQTEMHDTELEAVAGGASYSTLNYSIFNLFSQFRSGPSIGSLGGGVQQPIEEEEDIQL